MKGNLPKSATLTLQDALAKLPGPAGERYASMFEYPDLEIEFYAPRGNDPQQPHTRDEIYVVVQGRGYFVNGDSRRTFAPGDVLLVPAGIPHRFEDFSDDLMVWAFFINPR